MLWHKILRPTLALPSHFLFVQSVGISLQLATGWAELSRQIRGEIGTWRNRGAYGVTIRALLSHRLGMQKELKGMIAMSADISFAAFYKIW